MELMHPSVQKAFEYISRGLTENIWPLDSRLPSIPVLSKSAHVSTRAMQVAVGELARLGKLSVSRKRGIFAGQTVSYAASPASSLKWEAVKIRLEQDIYNNLFAEKILPSINELKKHYGCGYASLRRSLSTLVDESILVPYKKTYRIETLIGKHSFASVLLISPRLGDTEYLYTINDRFREAMQAFEKECAQANVNVRRIGSNNKTDDDIVRQLKNAANSETIIGYVIWANGLSSAKITLMVRTLLSLRRPISIFDDQGDLKLPDDLLKQGFVRIFSIANTQAGAQTAQYLIARGHRHIGFITPQPTAAWSKQRLLGMRTTFANAGYTDAVSEFGTAGTNTGFEHTGKNLSEINTAINRLPFFKEYGATMFGSLQAITFYNSAIYLIEDIKEYKRLVGSLGHILKNESITALVGANDATIIATIDAITIHKKATGKKIAFMGFDDTSSAFSFNLTSYNFNIQNTVGMMLQFIRNPAHHFFAGANGPIECKGFVVERSSSRLRV